MKQELTGLLNAPVVFAHNDLLSGNLMFNDEEGVYDPPFFQFICIFPSFVDYSRTVVRSISVTLFYCCSVSITMYICQFYVQFSGLSLSHTHMHS